MRSSRPAQSPSAWPPVAAMLLALASPVDAQVRSLPLSTDRGDGVGSALAADGDVLAVSAPGAGAGVVYLLRSDGDQWETHLRIEPPEGAQAVRFGTALALEATTLVVADVASPAGDAPQAGAVHVFTLDGSRRRILTSRRLLNSRPRIADQFGHAVALRGDLLAVGAPGQVATRDRTGAVLLFRRSGDQWRPLARLAPPEHVFGGQFGASLAFDGTTLAVGAPGVGPAGAVFVYAVGADGTTSTSPYQRLEDPRIAPGARWGTKVALAGNRLLVSATPASRAGSVSVWTRGASDGPWAPGDLLRSPVEVRAPGFGVAVALGDDMAVVGMPRDGTVAHEGGSIWVYEWEGEDRLRLRGPIRGPRGSDGERFGQALAVLGNRMMVGAAGSESREGAVYVLDAAAPATVRRSFRRLTTGIAKAVLEGPDGRLWVGTAGGLEIHDGYDVLHLTSDARDPESLSWPHVIALQLDRAGRPWVGTEDGLNRYLSETGRFVRYDLSEGAEADYPRQSVVAIFEDSRGIIWTGTNGRLFRYAPDEDRFREYRPFRGPPERLDETYVSGISEDPQGRLWVLAKNLWENRASLYRVALEQDRVDRYPLAPEWGQVGPFLIDDSGAFWLKAPAPARIPDRPGQPVKPAATPVTAPHWGMYQDRSGTVWVGTEAGFYQGPAGGPLERGWVLSDDDDSEPRIVHAVAEDAAGELLMATHVGTFRTLDRGDTVAPMPLLVSAVEILGAEGPRSRPGAGGPVLLSPDDLSVALEYAAVHLDAPEDVTYRYRLEPYDRDWVPAGDRRLALYTNLPPGDYTFRLEAEAPAGRGSARHASLALPVRVQPAFWETGLFRLLLASLVAAVLAGAIGYRRRQQRRVTEFRIRVAGDLHDDLSTNLSGIALASRMLRSTPELDAPTRERLDRIASTAETTIDDLRDIVWLVDPDRDTVEDLVSKMRDVARTLLADHDVSLSLDESLLGRMDMLQRRQLLLLYKEMLHNIVRHAGAEKIRIRMHPEKGDLFLTVTDDGRGFEVSTTSDGHGLRSMRERARQLDGELIVDSAPGRGTTLTVRFPA